MPLLRTVGRTAVIAGTASAVSGRVQRRQQTRWAEKEEAQAQQAQMQQAPPPAAQPARASGLSMDEKIEQLQQLAKLKEQGILTEQEFGAQKAKILG